MQDILSVGAAVRDVFLLSDQFQFIRSEQFEGGVGECVALGAKIDIERPIFSTGGGATNAAATFARLGFQSGIVCRVGDDTVGRDILEELKAEGIDTRLVTRVPKGTTAYSTLLTASNGERTAIVHRGVSATFRPTDIPWKTMRASWYYLTSLGGNLALAKRVIRHAAQSNAKIAWNPGNKEIVGGKKALADLLDDVTILSVNREEAARLTNQRDIPAMLKSLGRPGNIILITDGDKGAYAQQDGQAWFSGTTGVKAISRTGAGDAFGSGFVAAYMKSADIPRSLAIATLNAESVIKKIGAKAGLLKTWPSQAAIKRVPLRTLP